MGKFTKKKSIKNIVFKGITQKSKQTIKRESAAAKRNAKMTKEEWARIKAKEDGKWPQPPWMATDHGKGHTSYRDETFEVVTRWKETTRIQYKPHAKAPGSKSHIRYEKYSKAKTVGEALKLGSWPADWCWDYERGFIKVLGDVRKEPLDMTKVQDNSVLTDVDTCIHGWIKKELAKKLGLNVKDLSVDKISNESVPMRAHRLVAQREAKKRLEAADKAGRAITEAEVTKTLQEWAFAKNKDRQNVLPKGQDWVWSDTLGFLRARGDSLGHITRATTLYPDVTRLICRYLTDRLPPDVAGFKFTSLNLNCNYAGALHRDGNNFGPSCIRAFGDFTGGELNYWQEDDQSIPRDKLHKLPLAGKATHPLKDGIAMFNGNCAHSVTDFKGERFSIVYFTVNCHATAKPEDRAALSDLGMPLPAKDEDPHAHLRAPLGFRKLSAAKKAASKKPAFRFWSDKKLKPRNSRKKPVLKRKKA